MRLCLSMQSLLAATILTLGAPIIAHADGNGLSASDAWSRPTASADMSAVVYMTVKDSGPPTTLVSASTPVAAHADLHQTKEVNGMMEMLPVQSLPVSSASPIRFGPGGYHITGMHQALAVGQSFPITLTFANGAKVVTTVTVRSMTSGGSGDANSMGGMKM
jgi:copper(I)-binding protein